MTKQQPGFYTGPTELLEPNDHDKGGLAEYAVFNRLKEYSESLGISMILFCEGHMQGERVMMVVTYLKKLNLSSSSLIKAD